MEANSARTILITALAPIAWGTTYFVTAHFLPADLPLTGAAIRALPAGLLLLALVRRLPPRGWWWRSFVIGQLTVGGFFVLIYVVGSRLPSAVASPMMAASALATVVLARLLLGERAPRRQYVGGIVGVLGVVLLVGGAPTHLDVVGVVASAVALLMSSLGFVLTKRWKPPVPPTTFVAWQLVAGGLVLAPIALLVEGPPPAFTPSQWWALAFLGLVATAAAYVAWFHGLAHLPAGTVGLVGLLNPVAGAMLGLVVGGEILEAGQLLGMAIVLLGVFAGLPPRRTPTSPPIDRARPAARVGGVAAERGDLARCE